MEYKLRTIKDIVDKVPPDRISDCMAELTVLLIQASNMSSLIIESVNTLTPGSISGWTFPEEITWQDDNAGIVQNNFHIGDETLIVKTQRSTKSEN